MSFKTTILQIAPRWLVGTYGAALLRTFGQIFDNFYEQVRTGIKARLPAYAPDDALRFIANDRNIEPGPEEDPDDLRARLVKAIPANRQRGSAHQLLKQLAGYFSGMGTPALRLVSNSAVWHEYDWGTGEVTKTSVGTNWTWDSHTDRWWRGWVIIDGSSIGITAAAELGDGTTLDDGTVIGAAGVTESMVEALQRIVQKWKPAHVHCVRIIITFDSGVFTRTNPAALNPQGNYDDPANWNPNAVYLLSGGEEPPLS